ncbi:tyrosine-protein phosphatase [Colwellia sp. Bg11-28]|uniref:tyrosine-protein phosphatase n=1 Tax=Colwellia sp. Bg11-28 TaxID=2058305 RepID=UPI0018E2F119|nr:CpsB/CapC family capsule biosynthesis tyrosine phosphatase [Colwellia sp. Bg11-28]
MLIDIHSHILPCVDDGARTNTEALEMLRMAVDGGVTTQILTPHIHMGRFENNKNDLEQRFIQFRDSVDKANIRVKLQLGAEVRIGPEVMMLVNNNLIPWMGEYQGKKTFLLEFPRLDIPFGSDNLVKWLLAKNCLPIIVHPERNSTFLNQRHKLQPFIDLGCPLQLTACSLTGKFGKEVQKMSEELLEANQVAAIASDCHNLKGRMPDLGPTWHNCNLFDKEKMLKKTRDLVTEHNE